MTCELLTIIGDNMGDPKSKPLFGLKTLCFMNRHTRRTSSRDDEQTSADNIGDRIQGHFIASI